MVGKSLTTVVPIRDMSGKLSKVFQTILESKKIDIQIILAVDTSIDGTYEEIEQFLAKENPKNVILLSGNFGSVGAARNAGLREVRTNFVTFWDSDDEPNPRIYLEALAGIDKVERVTLIGNFEVIRLDKPQIPPKRHPQGKHQLFKFARNPGIWRIIFSIDLLKELEFSQIPMGEDQEFLIQILLQKPEIIFINEVFYKYYSGHAGQATGSKEKKMLNYLVYDSTAKTIQSNKYLVPFPVAGMFVFQFFGMIKNSNPSISFRRIPNFILTLARIVFKRISQINKKNGEM